MKISPAIASNFVLLVVLITGMLGCGGPQIQINENFFVSHVNPHHGAVDVDSSTVLQIGFNTSVANDTGSLVSLFFEDGSALVEVPFTVQVAEGGTLLILTPADPLAQGTHRLEIAGTAESQEGLSLGSPLTSRFTVASVDDA
ncbi:MAG: Ig-like domain-containing protein [Deltaproteobacteria bacterium]|nr:Ig-like domain-containing protein [Deltaproteobacteria bacterium]